MGWKRHLYSDFSEHRKAGRHRPASETPFEWRFAVGPMVARDRMQAGMPDNGANAPEFNLNIWTIYRLAIHTRMLKFKQVQFTIA